MYSTQLSDRGLIWYQKKQNATYKCRNLLPLSSFNIAVLDGQHISQKSAFPLTGIPVEEEEEEQDTSIKGRLLALLYKIKGPPHKTEEEPTETEQAAPSK